MLDTASVDNQDALILAAGTGRRMKKIVNKRPGRPPIMDRPATRDIAHRAGATSARMRDATSSWTKERA